LLADAFDTEQLLECMGQLKRAQPVNVSVYDFKKHRRCSESFRNIPVTHKLVSICNFIIEHLQLYLFLIPPYLRHRGNLQ